VRTDTVAAHDGDVFGRSAPLVAAAAIGLAAAVGFLLVRTARVTTRPPADDRRKALADYLREHVTGSDVALGVVARLRRTHAGTEAGGLFASLSEDFAEERQAVRELLESLDDAPHAPKRLAGVAMGRVLAPPADGRYGDMSLYRTIEALAIGVQGKRCLWRTLQSLGFTHPAAEGRSVADFEAMAVRQWEALEHYRLTLSRATFAQNRIPETRAARIARS
jgi:hypothetical protein